MKKVIAIGLSLLIFFSLSPFGVAKEKTLDQLQAEAKANREAYQKAKNQKDLTEKERKEATAKKNQVQTDIKNIKSELKKLENENANLSKVVNIKKTEIKKLMSYVQMSEGQSGYLEYILGAKSFTDFIYRISVAEELSQYNEQNIKEYNKDIKKIEQNQKELTSNKQQLDKKSQELTLLEAKLNKEIETVQEGMLTKDEEYRTLENTIKSMKKMNCSGSDTESACKAKISAQVKPAAPSKAQTSNSNNEKSNSEKSNNSSSGNSNSSSSNNSDSHSGSTSTAVPNSYNTYYPIARGYLTSDYGQRSGEYHTGMDWSSGSVDPVYPVAGGKVINIDYGSTSTCGNNRIYVLHNINGKMYTTSYWHLVSVNVRVGQDVSADTMIGKMGGRGYKDPCASGGHVHLNLFNGYTTSNSGRIDPKTILPNAPKEWTYFNHR